MAIGTTLSRLNSTSPVRFIHARALSTLEAGGDFADGAVAQEGLQLGADEFVSFDKKAVSILQSQGKRARLLA